MASGSPWKKTVIRQGDKTKTTPNANYDMEASDVIKSPLEEAAITGPEAVQRLADARAMDNTDIIGKSFMNKMRKFGAGSKEALYETEQFLSAMDDMILPETYYDKANEISDDAFRYETYNRKLSDLKQEQDQVDVMNKEFNQVKGIPGFLGELGAYGAVELATGPISTKLAKGVGDVVSRGVSATGREVAKESSALAKWLTEQNPQLIKDIGKYSQEKIGKPISKLAQRYIGRESVGNPNRIGMMTDIGAGTGIGAVTGLMDYDASILEGAVAGTASSLTGSALTKPLSKRYDANRTAGRDVIDYMKSKKYYVDPGVDTGSTAAYNKTRKLKSDDATSELMQTYTDANQKVVNKVAYGTMGFSKEQSNNMTPKIFDEGIKKAGKEFDTLVEGTKGFIPKKSYEQMNTKLDNLINNPASSTTMVKEAREVLAYLTDPKNVKVTRHPGTGRFQKATFDGKVYQEMRSTLKEKIDKLFDAGDTVTARELRPVLKYLDDSLEIGIKRGGTVTPGAWAKAREKWAMGEILKTKGVNSADMNVDSHKLFKAFKNDPRMMTDAKGPVSDLMNLGKFSEIERKLNERAGVLSGTHQSKKGHIMSSLDEADARLHMLGWPNQYGYLGMNRYKGRYKPSTFSRPIGQASSMWPYVGEKAEDTYEFMKNPIDNSKKGFKDLINWYDEE